MSRRVVITGVGFGLPGLAMHADAWASLLAGESHVHPLDDAWLNVRWPGPWQVAGPGAPFHIHGCWALQLLQVVGLPTMTRAKLAAQLSPTIPDPDRFAAVIGASKGSLRYPESDSLAALFEAHDAPFPDRVAPSSLLDEFCEHFPETIRRTSPVAACATGLVSVVQAARWIRWGEVDTAIAGSADAAASPIVLASYRRLGVLTKTQPRPFDVARDGFVIGEGAGLLVLDTEAAAASRGAEPLAVLAGEDLRSDASGLVAAAPDGEAVAVTVGNALSQAGLQPRDIDAIVLHGTGTRQNDLSEGRGLRRVFGPRLNAIPAASIKGAWGHTLGASGAIEAAVAVQMLVDQVVPPHCFADDIDPACEVSNLASDARPMPLRHVLKLSLGFGGHVAAAIFSRTYPLTKRRPSQPEA